MATSVTAVHLASASRSYCLLQSVISDLGGFAYFFFYQNSISAISQAKPYFREWDYRSRNRCQCPLTFSLPLTTDKGTERNWKVRNTTCDLRWSPHWGWHSSVWLTLPCVLTSEVYSWGRGIWRASASVSSAHRWLSTLEQTGNVGKSGLLEQLIHTSKTFVWNTLLVLLEHLLLADSPPNSGREIHKNSRQKTQCIEHILGLVDSGRYCWFFSTQYNLL